MLVISCPCWNKPWRIVGTDDSISPSVSRSLFLSLGKFWHLSFYWYLLVHRWFHNDFSSYYTYVNFLRKTRTKNYFRHILYFILLLHNGMISLGISLMGNSSGTISPDDWSANRYCIDRFCSLSVKCGIIKTPRNTLNWYVIIGLDVRTENQFSTQTLSRRYSISEIVHLLCTEIDEFMLHLLSKVLLSNSKGIFSQENC